MSQLIQPASQSKRVELLGDFTAGYYVVVEQVGNTVTVTTVQQCLHASMNNPRSLDGVIPSWARPTSSRNGSVYLGGRDAKITVTSTGMFQVAYYDDSGALLSATATGFISITYLIAGNIP